MPILDSTKERAAAHLQLASLPPSKIILISHFHISELGPSTTIFGSDYSLVLSSMVKLITLVLSGLEDTNSGASGGSWSCKALVVSHWLYTGALVRNSAGATNWSSGEGAPATCLPGLATQLQDHRIRLLQPESLSIFCPLSHHSGWILSS